MFRLNAHHSELDGSSDRTGLLTSLELTSFITIYPGAPATAPGGADPDQITESLNALPFQLGLTAAGCLLTVAGSYVAAR